MGNSHVKLGADVNELDKSSYTKLMEVVHKGDIERVKALLKAGADVNKSNNKEFTSLIVAARYGSDECIKTIGRSRSQCERPQQERFH